MQNEEHSEEPADPARVTSSVSHNPRATTPNSRENLQEEQASKKLKATPNDHQEQTESSMIAHWLPELPTLKHSLIPHAAVAIATMPPSVTTGHQVNSAPQDPRDREILRLKNLLLREKLKVVNVILEKQERDKQHTQPSVSTTSMPPCPYQDPGVADLYWSLTAFTR